MPDFRFHPAISQRYDLMGLRRAKGLRGRYGRWSLAAMLAAGALLVLWMFQGDERVYWSRPVSPSHAMFQQECAACHTQPGAPLVRLMRFDDELPGVSDAACQKCHGQASHDHHGQMLRTAVRGCVDCHREHGQRARLAAVPDARCTECHADLKTADGRQRFATQVASFAAHPEFKLWRSDDAAQFAQRGFVPRDPQGHQLATLADPVAAEGSEPPRWQDRTPLKFNHRLHLVDEGVLIPWDHPGALPGGQTRKTLQCGDCHQADASGQYMQPILYAEHCASCHRLEFSGKLAAGGPLPHEQVHIVQAVLRERLMAYALQNPQVLDPAPAETPRLPNKQAAQPTIQDRWQWVEQELGRVEQEVFTSVQHGCAYCHTLREGAVVPPNIPERWLPHSRFDHARHREVSCIACHDPDFERRSERGHERQGVFSQLASQQTSDLLLPRIAVCQACHGPQPGSRRHGARADCIVCHDYHHGPPGSGNKLDAWLQQRQER